MNNYRISQCRDARCGADIIWAVTASGHRNMPVDPTPRPDGNVLLTLHDGQDTPIARIVDPHTPPLGGWEGDLYVSHFSTCPGAEEWRTRRRHTP